MMGEPSFVARNFPCCFPAIVMMVSIALHQVARRIWPK